MVFFLERLIRNNQINLVLNFLKNRIFDKANFPHFKEDFILLNNRYNRIIGRRNLGLLGQEESVTAIKQITVDCLRLIEKLVNLSILDNDTSQFQFEPTLAALLDEIYQFCDSKNIHPYTPVLLIKHMEHEDSQAIYFLNNYHPGLGNALKQQFLSYINDVLLTQRMGASFENFEWDDLECISSAKGFAWMENRKYVSLKDFLLGIINSKSSTIESLVTHNGFDTALFTEIVLKEGK